MVYIISGVLIMTAQSALLRIPAIRRAAGIPAIPKSLQGKGYTMRESLQALVKTFRSARDEARNGQKRIR